MTQATNLDVDHEQTSENTDVTQLLLENDNLSTLNVDLPEDIREMTMFRDVSENSIFFAEANRSRNASKFYTLEVSDGEITTETVQRSEINTRNLRRVNTSGETSPQFD